MIARFSQMLFGKVEEGLKEKMASLMQNTYYIFKRPKKKFFGSIY